MEILMAAVGDENVYAKSVWMVVMTQYVYVGIVYQRLQQIA
jgi:hypothetical protein